MKHRLYPFLRDLHLYVGLFISPFVLLFAVSVFFLTHRWLPQLTAPTPSTRVVSSLALPPDLLKLSGRPLIEALKPTLERVNVPGEIGFVRHLVQEETLVVPVTVPGRETSVSLSFPRQEATIMTRDTGLADALVTLHRSPGQHGPDIRRNWFAMKVWSWLADATVYLLLLTTATGVYLWSVLRAERAIGLVLLFAGFLSLLVFTYALSR